MKQRNWIGRWTVRVVCFLILTLSISACGKDTERKDAQFITPTGVSLNVGDAVADLRERLGEPEDYSEAPSCYGNGKDKVYTYKSFSVTTYPNLEGTEEFISVITLLDDRVETGQGLRLGMTFEEVVRICGEDYVSRGDSRIYTEADGSALWIDLNNDIISGIEYRAP